MLRRTLLTIVLFAGGLSADRPPLTTGVDSIGLTVSNLDRSVEFYSTVLTFEKVAEYEGEGSEYEHLNDVFGLHFRRARMRLGNESIELTEYLAPTGRPAPPDSRSNDRWFQHVAIIVSDMDRAYATLRAHHVQHASPSPQRLPDWNKNAGGIQAFYFRDPDGHPLEVLAFPADKGAAKWHQLSDKLFLGIDHTAIVISDTDASLHFYRDELGLKVAGDSENYGIEQERLNNVFGARLHITAVRGETGPGIEFLEYLAPHDGRPYPADEKVNDLIHWQTRLRTSSAMAAAQALAESRNTFLSTGAVALPRASAAPRESVIVRDPDGHAVELAVP
jgi:catechol 2,3-dioxygenase-like lactoylglutathione lyase family enzyme